MLCFRPQVLKQSSQWSARAEMNYVAGRMGEIHLVHSDPMPTGNLLPGCAAAACRCTWNPTETHPPAPHPCPAPAAGAACRWVRLCRPQPPDRTGSAAGQEWCRWSAHEQRRCPSGGRRAPQQARAGPRHLTFSRQTERVAKGRAASPACPPGPGHATSLWPEAACA